MPNDLSVWTYLYTHERTEATTGYFSCEPELPGTFELNLRRLASRPMDSFLHGKLLKDISAMDPEDWRKLARRCEGEALPSASGSGDDVSLTGTLSCLLLECAHIRQDCRENLRDLIGALQAAAGAWREYSPFPHLLKFWQRDGSATEGSFDRYKDLKTEKTVLAGQAPEEAMDEELSRTILSLEKERGLLKRLHADFMPPQKSREAPPAAEVALLAKERLEKAGLLHGPEMRHEASLSPIALLRQWKVHTEIRHGRHGHILKGLAAAYGRGLSLAQARASCLMEIVERASAYVSIRPGGRHDSGEIEGLSRPQPLVWGSSAALLDKGYRIFTPAQGETSLAREFPLYWLEGSDMEGEKLLVPAQSVFLFLNLDEASLFEQGASTGLASGSSMAQAKAAALTEILERDADATQPHSYRACFILRSRDEKIQSLLDDYRAKRIFLYMQDISHETGFPVYRCIVQDRNGRAYSASAAALDGRKAALSALTETPWPYSWASPLPSSKLSSPPPANLPVRFLEDLPNYSYGEAEADLALMEKLLLAQGLPPVYVDISRKDLLFPVVRAFIPAMECSPDFDASMPPGLRFRARNYLYTHKRF